MVEQRGPRQASSQRHALAWHSPLSEQSRSVEQLRAAKLTKRPAAMVVAICDDFFFVEIARSETAHKSCLSTTMEASPPPKATKRKSKTKKKKVSQKRNPLMKL
jgi:hypothetical protein